MITIKYQKYWNDYNTSYETKTFYTLNEYKAWILDILDGNTDKWYHSIPTPQNYPDEPRRIEACSRDGWSYWTHMIVRDGAIIFSDGEYTDGIKHWNDDVKSFLADLKNKIEHPHFNFG